MFCEPSSKVRLAELPEDLGPGVHLGGPCLPRAVVDKIAAEANKSGAFRRAFGGRLRTDAALVAPTTARRERSEVQRIGRLGRCRTRAPCMHVARPRLRAEDTAGHLICEVRQATGVKVRKEKRKRFLQNFARAGPAKGADRRSLRLACAALAAAALA